MGVYGLLWFRLGLVRLFSPLCSLSVLLHCLEMIAFVSLLAALLVILPLQCRLMLLLLKGSPSPKKHFGEVGVVTVCTTLIIALSNSSPAHITATI